MTYPIEENAEDAVTIMIHELKMLEPNTCINDSLIDFRLKLLVEAMSRQERKRVHVFSTLFYPQVNVKNSFNTLNSVQVMILNLIVMRVSEQ